MQLWKRLILAIPLVFLAQAAQGQWIGRGEPAWEKEFQAWIADPHQRVYPNSFGRPKKSHTIEVEGCRNENIVFQLGVRSPVAVKSIRVKPNALVSSDGAKIAADLYRIRFPGLMPADEYGQYTPDPLWEVPSVSLRPLQSQGIWIDLKVPRDAASGVYQGTLELVGDSGLRHTFKVKLNVIPVSLPDPEGFHCYFNILFDPSSVARFNKLPLWGDEHWRQLERYVQNLARHGQKTITAFIVDDPWSMATGFPVRNMIEWKFAGEWKADGGRFSFDFTPFDRFVRMCLRAGIKDHIECWSPLVQPHSDHSMVTYTDTTTGQRRKIRLPASSEEYKKIWGDFAHTFQEHLRAKGWLEKTYLAFDEIDTAYLDHVIPFFRQTAPELKLMISGGDEEGRYMGESRELAFHYGWYGKQTGAELPDISSRRKAGKRSLLYTAVTPLYPNTFIFSQPLESRYLPWIVWKWDFDGYIRWAWNFWPATLWDQPRYKWRSGDMFLVYPGSDGPIDSMRCEMLREGIEDYECLWLVRKAMDEAKRRGTHSELVARAEKTMNEAMELATQQFDPVRRHRPLPTSYDQARKMINRLLAEFASIQLLPR